MSPDYTKFYKIIYEKTSETRNESQNSSLLAAHDIIGVGSYRYMLVQFRPLCYKFDCNAGCGNRSEG